MPPPAKLWSLPVNRVAEGLTAETSGLATIRPRLGKQQDFVVTIAVYGGVRIAVANVQ
jgi:hypothetical protein